MKTILLVFLSAFSLFSQSDWNRWGKADFHYSKNPKENKRNYSLEGNNAGETLVKSAMIVYWVTFSDLDGDNCPFTPTCSSFFIQSVKETNIVQGTLMFFDRFTRDMNIFERYKHYPVIKNDHFYDPTSLYTLNEKNTREALREFYRYSIH